MPHISKISQENDVLIQAVTQRIMIVGRPGSGKSTFSIKLQAILNIPLFHHERTVNVFILSPVP